MNMKAALAAVGATAVAATLVSVTVVTRAAGAVEPILGSLARPFERYAREADIADEERKHFESLPSEVRSTVSFVQFE